jgi:hypothetical protein
MAIILIGLVGNGLGVFVFAQRRFRASHSSGIYLLFVCLADALFLLMHFFEDTLRTYIDVFLNHNTFQMDTGCLHLQSNEALNATMSSIMKSIRMQQQQQQEDAENWFHYAIRLSNITDRFDLACRTINFLRYYVRFLSAYFILAFTIQRTLALRFSLSRGTFESSRLVWRIVLVLFVVGFVLNSWVPFVFRKVIIYLRVYL